MMNALAQPQSVAVFGATSEIARALLVELQAPTLQRVVIAARPSPERDNVQAELAGRGVAVTVLDFDAADHTAHASVVEAAFADGDLDLVVIAFGVLGNQADFESRPELAVSAAQVNYVGGVSVGLLVTGRLRDQGHGTLVVLSSVAGERARASNFVYGSTKAGLDVFATGLGDSLQGTGVHVMVVRPGFVRTRMTDGLPEAPLSVGPEEVAAAIVSGLKHQRETVYVPSTMRYVMSGLRHLPRSVFRKLPI